MLDFVAAVPIACDSSVILKIGVQTYFCFILVDFYSTFCVQNLSFAIRTGFDSNVLFNYKFYQVD